MIKKEYMKPTMSVVKIQHHSIICTSRGIQSTNNSSDSDNPVYNNNKKGGIWDAN